MVSTLNVSTEGKSIPDKLMEALEDHRKKYETAEAKYYDDVRELEVWTRDIGRYDSSSSNEGRYVDYLERLVSPARTDRIL